MADVQRIKNDVWNYVEIVDSGLSLNSWPRLTKDQMKSYFTWTFMPWYDNCYIDWLEVWVCYV